MRLSSVPDGSESRVSGSAGIAPARPLDIHPGNDPSQTLITSGARIVRRRKNGSERRRQPCILSGTYSLEDRVVLSSIGRSTLPLPPAQVSRLLHIHQEATLPGERPVPSAVRLGNHPARHPVSTAVFPTVKRWSWLAGTYWYVPTSNLPAVLFNSSTGTLAPVSDQTVFHITGYRDGYFWGKTVTQLGSSSASCSSMVGSVTPEGKVLLTFTQTSSSSSPSITEGFGTMQRKVGQWTMENQMFTSPSETLQIGHWAYMVQTHPGLPSWKSLPSAGISVPAFLSQCDGCGPQPVVS